MIALANDLLHQQNIEYIMRFISKKKIMRSTCIHTLACLSRQRESLKNDINKFTRMCTKVKYDCKLVKDEKISKEDNKTYSHSVSNERLGICFSLRLSLALQMKIWMYKS